MWPCRNGDRISDKDIKLMVTDLTAATVVVHKYILSASQQMRREASRRRGSEGTLPKYCCGRFGLVAKVRQAGKSSEHMSTWSGPWRVSNASKKHVYKVQKNIVDGNILTVHVVRIKFFLYSGFIPADITQTFQYLTNQVEFEMEGILELTRSTNGNYEAFVNWKGCSEAERSWEPISTLRSSSPSFLIKELKKVSSCL